MTAMVGPRMISSDSHVVEPPDLWTRRIDRAFAGRAPRVVAEEDADYWVVDGVKTNSFSGGAQTGQRFDDPKSLKTAARFADVREGAYDAAAHLAENEQDGVYGSVLYPTEGLLLYTVPDSQLLDACCRAYNDWLAEMVSFSPARLKGIAMLNVDDVEEAVRELERAQQLGLSGAMISVDPGPEIPYRESRYEPLWEAAESLQMPLSLHVGTNRGTLYKFGSFRGVAPSALATVDCFVRLAIGDIILSGVFERHPGLKVGIVEHELAWLPFFIDRLDYTYTQRAHRPGWYRFASDRLPSDFFRQNVFVSFQEDALGVQHRDLIGVETLMWGSDYPHTESTFPRSRQIVDEMLADVPDNERRMILYENVASLYGFDMARQEVGATP
jgi:predicted TIM-barrel fold metal-dependent hydrolase